MPLVAALTLSDEGHPLFLKLSHLSGFTLEEIAFWATKKIPKFDASNKSHIILRDLSIDAHNGDTDASSERFKSSLNLAAAEALGLSKSDLELLLDTAE